MCMYNIHASLCEIEHALLFASFSTTKNLCRMHICKKNHVFSVTYPFCGRNIFRFLCKHNLQWRANSRCFAHTLVGKAPRLSRTGTLLLAGTLFPILLRALGWSGIEGESDSRGVDGGRGVEKFLFRNHEICWVVRVSVFVRERARARARARTRERC